MTSKLRRLKDNKHMLLILKDASPKLRKAILKNCNEEIIKSIVEIVMNILHGNLKTSGKNQNELKKYKKQLRTIAKPTKNYSLKRKVLLQKGGSFIPIILGSLLSGILSGLMKK